jgi:X-Pro dipeptidyl-peptidase (S15 family)
MRNRSFYFLLLALLGFPTAALAQQNSAANGKEADKKSDVKAAPAPVKEVENWQVLTDIKTGLQPRPPFEVQQDEEPDFVRELVRVQWRLGESIDLWIMRPKTTGKVPVVLYLYSYPGDSDLFRNDGWAKRATANGFAAVGFVSALTGARYHFRPMKQWFISELTESLGSSVHDVQLILNYLADRGDMDMDHVGMFGMGSGATIAVLAAQADPRIKTLDLLDPWGDWPDWLRDSPSVPENERPKYITPEFLKSVTMLDPVAYLPSLKTRGLRVQQNLSDPVTPQSAKQRIAASVPDPVQLVKYNNAADLMKAWQGTGLSGWIKQQMRSDMQNEAGAPGLTARDSSSPQN